MTAAAEVRRLLAAASEATVLHSGDTLVLRYASLTLAQRDEITAYLTERLPGTRVVIVAADEMLAVRADGEGTR